MAIEVIPRQMEHQVKETGEGEERVYFLEKTGIGKTTFSKS